MDWYRLIRAPMTYVVIGVEAFIIVLLLLTVAVGQPAAAAQDRAQFAAFRATIEAQPKPTARPCHPEPPYFQRC